MARRCGMSNFAFQSSYPEPFGISLANSRVDAPKMMTAVYLVSLFLFDNSIVYQVALLLAAGSILLFDRGWMKSQITPLIYSFGLLFVYFFFHTFLGFTQTPSASISKLIGMITTFISICSVAYILQSRRCFDFVMDVIICIGIFFALYAVFVLKSDVFVDTAWNTVPKPFLSGETYAHNDLPTVFAFSLFFLRYKLLKPIDKSGVLRCFQWLLIILFLCLTVLSGARKGLICAAFGLIVFPILCTGERKSFAIKTVAILAVLTMFFIAVLNIDFLYNSIGYRFDAILHGLAGGDYTEGSARYRDMIASYAWVSISKKWIVGYGLNSFGQLSGFGGWAENGYLDLWFSGGLIAVVIFVSFYLYAIVKLYGQSPRSIETILYLVLTIWFLINNSMTVAYSSRILLLISCFISSFLTVSCPDSRTCDFNNNSIE